MANRIHISDFLSAMGQLRDGDKMDVYGRPEGFLDLFLQEPQQTAIKAGNTLDIYAKPPGLFGRTFQMPDSSIVQNGNEVEVYNQPPGIFGRTFQLPDQRIKIQRRSKSWLERLLED